MFVELTPSDAFLVKNTAQVTQLVVNADGRIGMGVQPNLHRLSVKSATSTADGSALFVQNSSEQGLALVTETTSSDVNSIFGQHGAGDFLYCDSWDGLSNWQRVLSLRKNGSVEARGLRLTDADSTGAQYGFIRYNSGSPNGLGFLVDLADPPAMIIRETQNVGIGTTDPGSHRLSVVSGADGTGGSTDEIENVGALGVAMIATTWSADVNTVLGQRGNGDFLYCDSWDGELNWQRVLALRRNGSVEARGLRLTDAASTGSQYGIIQYNSGAPGGLGFLVNSSDPPAMIVRETQNVGIGTAYPGSHRLSVKSGASGTAGSSVEIENDGAAGIAMVATTWSSDVNTLLSQRGTGDFLYCDAWDGSSNWRRVIRMLKDGTVECKVLSITGGADLAEPFDVSATDGMSAEPGRVMVIDQEHEGQLKVSSRAYDRCVAGVVSGAGGVSPGVLLRQEGTEATGKHPVALTGRVYGWADATTEPIRPGDLLTTSATPGHAMKVTDAERAQGAILGKAMSALPEGRGLVLILVTLQ